MGIENIAFVTFPNGGPPPWGECPNAWELANSANITLSVSGGTLTIDLSGVIPIVNGGTNNGFLDVTAGGIIFADGAALQSTGPGPPGAVLTAPQTGTTPEWKPPFDSYIYSQGGF